MKRTLFTILFFISIFYCYSVDFECNVSEHSLIKYNKIPGKGQENPYKETSICRSPQCGEDITPIEHDERTGLSRETYALKGGYTLIIESTVWKCSDGEEVSSCRVCLQRENTVRVIENMLGYLNRTRYAPRYENTDFEDYFVLTYYFDCYYHHLIEKETGALVLAYTGGTADTERNLLIYSPLNGYDFTAVGDNLTDTVFLRDLSAKKDYDLMPYIEREWEKGTYSGTNWWLDAFEITSATEESVTVRFRGFYDWQREEYAELIFTVPRLNGGERPTPAL